MCSLGSLWELSFSERGASAKFLYTVEYPMPWFNFDLCLCTWIAKSLLQREAGNIGVQALKAWNLVERKKCRCCQKCPAFRLGKLPTLEVALADELRERILTVAILLVTYPQLKTDITVVSDLKVVLLVHC